MKEFEKLLNQEELRKLNVKAKIMTDLGLFEQETLEKFDLGKLEKITYANKKYKGTYDLYKSSTGQLIYVHAKNEGASAYEYDIINIDVVTDEEYEAIKKAGSQEQMQLMKICRGGLIGAIVFLMFAILMVLFESLQASLPMVNMVANLTLPISFLGLCLGLLVVVELQYRRFIGK